ncbi:AGAP011638-PA-like protein [Anopheles sinensis]|uniref:AGAP011638-PA-like protein n=1 Tax=Anopheles sinensis TaxID=74873 RepID=A0A084WQ25_ANOSI|nr:AGAP011638-PA-like protein [Anopheles sinensis]
MHVMEDSSDALVVCSEANLATNLKPSPKEHAAELSPSVGKLSIAASPEEKLETTVEPSVSEITTASSTDNQSETKEAESVKQALGERETERDSKEVSSSTTGSDKMPTATAIEVSERIADSSDDIVSVLESKKSISAATTPSVNSAASMEPGDGKAKESNTTVADEAVPKVGTISGKNDATTVQEDERKSPTNGEENEPTTDEVMEGIDDFMEHNGSDGKEPNGQDESKFNEDLAFQMDVDDRVPDKRPVPEQVVEQSDKTDDGKHPEESAMDLTATLSEPQQSKQDTPVSMNEKDPIANVTASVVVSACPVPVDVVDSSPEKCGQHQLSSTATGLSKKSNLEMHDKTIITSTPIAVASEKRTECAQGPSAPSHEGSMMEVKREVDEVGGKSQRDVQDEVQNLSTSKPTARNDSDNQPDAVSRKRRRSVDQDDGHHSRTDSDEPVEPAKKLKLEVEANYQTHERVVNEYIEATPNTSVDEIQCHADTLVKEIQSLNDMIRDTEQKWNNLLHLKKVKEEILLRLNRRKHVIGITETRLGEVSAFSHLDSSNLSSHHQLNQQRSSSVGPRPPTPPPEVEIRPASVSTTMNYSNNASNGLNSVGSKHSQIPNRRNSSITAGSSGHKNTGGRRSGSTRDTNSFVSQFNSNNNSVTMVPLPNTTSMILQARASMNSAEIAKEKAVAMQVQRQLFPKPVLSNQQQILNNLAMSAGLTSLTSGAGNSTSNTALLNGHHNPNVSSANSGGTTSREQQQLQIGRQGMRKDVSSIIADYRQKHPENVPRRGRRMKHVGGSSGSNNGGTSTGNSIGSFAEGNAISLTALPGGKSPAGMGSAARSSSTDSVANRLSDLLAAAENSRPSSNDSSQSSSNLLSSLVSASGGAANASSTTQQQFLKDVLVQFAKMSQNEQSLLSNLQLLANNAVLASTGQSTATTNTTVSSPQQSPQHFQHQQQQQQQAMPQLHSSLLSKASLPEVTLHPVMNSTAHSDIIGSHHTTGTLVGANLSAVNTSSNSLLHGILTKSNSRPGSGAAAATNNFNSFSPTLARLLTGPERMNAVQPTTSSSSTVTSGALANLQTAGVIGGLNLSKNNSEISITPVDDEADDSADRLVIDEGDDMAGSHRDAISKRRVAEINENEVPQCQGCKKNEAKFVCAGCNHQWYCSRECQVNAWDDHSEVCSG